MSLAAYRRKRHFSTTSEPKGKKPRRRTGRLYVIHKHRARNLHYDLRLELDGVLKSWAVPKGPSLDPRDKRLAIQVEDHPLEYGDFEGNIPEGEFGEEMAVLWPVSQQGDPYPVRIAPSRIERQRHARKYEIGELPPDRSFYFRGPAEKINLRAQNLHIFLQLAEGVDAETWMHHLRQGDYSRWFRKHVKDDQLASDAERVEQETDLSADESRARIRELIERYYTPSVSPPLPIPGTDASPARRG